MILIINTDIIKLTIVDGLHQVTLTCLIAVGHFNHFLLRGLALSACFPDMFWYQWTINVKVKKKDQVKLSSDVSKMSSHPYYACSCPATDTRAHQCQTVCMTFDGETCLFSYLWVACRLLLGTGQPVACKIEFAPVANITPNITPAD